jgi:hypothetical protein
MSFKGLEPGRVKQILEIFKLAGTFVAKSIVDDRRMELPISSLMWDVLFDKKPNLVDISKYDTVRYESLVEF